MRIVRQWDGVVCVFVIADCRLLRHHRRRRHRRVTSSSSSRRTHLPSPLLHFCVLCVSLSVSLFLSISRARCLFVGLALYRCVSGLSVSLSFRLSVSLSLSLSVSRSLSLSLCVSLSVSLPPSIVSVSVCSFFPVCLSLSPSLSGSRLDSLFSFYWAALRETSNLKKNVGM